MQFPNLLRKWLRSKDAEPVRYAPKGLVFKFCVALMAVLMLMIILLAPDDPIRYCRCLDREQRLEEAQLSPAEQEARQRAQREALQRVRRLQAEVERQDAARSQRELKAVRTPAADRVRQALKEWEREQAVAEAVVRAARKAVEEGYAVPEPAAEMAPQ